MSFPKSDIRAAVKVALEAKCTYLVTDIPVPETNDYVNIQAIRLAESTPQSFMGYDCYVTIEIVTRFQKTGNRASGDAQAVLVDEAMRPSITGGIAVSGWDMSGTWLSDQSEDLSNDSNGKAHRIIMNYFIKYYKS